MNYLEAFHSLENHPHFSKLYKKLRKNDFEIAEKFIAENMHKNRADFEFTLNRFFLNQDEKPKKWLIILELLSTSNIKANPIQIKKRPKKYER